MAKMTFETFSNRVRQNVGYENSSRIQYRDDEETFITMNSDDDFEDARRCICPVMNYDNLYRLCIRVDDSVTPKSPAKKKHCVAEKHAESSDDGNNCVASRRKLNFTLSAKMDSEPVKLYSEAETPLQRYISSTQKKVNEKLNAKQKLVIEETDITTNVENAKSQSDGKGAICHNCHMRLRHTSRNCTFEQCTTIYSCGEEKLHPVEISRLKQIRQSISKLDKEIQQLRQEIETRQAAVNNVNNLVTKRIETELLEADECAYIENGVRNWQLLRTHVYALECYSKRNLNGKIPPKHQIKSVLNLALNVENADHKISQPRKHRQNPCKNVLEKHGIVFPESNDPACNADQSDLRYMPMTKEEEEEQLKIVLSASARATSTSSHDSSFAPQQQPIQAAPWFPQTLPQPNAQFLYHYPSQPVFYPHNFEVPNPCFAVRLLSSTASDCQPYFY